MASDLFTKFLACSVGMGLFITLMILTAPQWSRFFAAKWSVRLWAVLGACLCLPLTLDVPAVEAFFSRYPWIMACWLVIALLILGFAFYRQFRFRKEALHWSNEPENSAFAVKAARLAEELNMRKVPIIRVTAKVACPTTVGIGDPLLLLPHETYSDGEFDIILRHEFYHYLHSHISYKVFLSVVCALHWFNPAVWMMREKASIDLEAACDDALLADASEKTRRQYSDTILSVMQSPSVSVTPFATHAYGSPMATGRRLVRLLSAPPKTGGAALLCVAVILSFLSGTAVAAATAKLEASAAPTIAPEPVGSSSATEQLPATSMADTDEPFPDDDISQENSAVPKESSEDAFTASREESSEDEAVSSTESSTLEESSEEASVSSSEDAPASEESSQDSPDPTPDEPAFPLESAMSVADALPGALRSLNSYASQFLGASEGIEDIVVPGKTDSGMPSDDILMMIINRVVDGYNNGTVDTTLADPDAPRLMPIPAAIEGDLPTITDPDDFSALPRTANGYSISVPIPGSGMELQIWVDDNGTDDTYEFDVVAARFARG